MKTKIISIVVMLLMACNVMGEDLAYFYLNNGRCIPLPVSVLSKMEVSKLDMNNIQHSDYQTQKIVTNDTTVFISLSEIDSIVFDKKEITDYPKTEKEIKESIDLSNSIASKSKQIVDSLADLGEMDINVIVEEIRKLDGVIVANADSSQSVINIIQKDGICINKLIKIDEPQFINENEKEYIKSQSSLLSPNRLDLIQGRDDPYIAPHKKALILAPFQSSFSKNLDYLKEQLENVYEIRPVVYENNSADILKFKGEYLSQFDLIFIDTHGGCGTFRAPRSKIENGLLSIFDVSPSKASTALTTGSKYNKEFVDYYINENLLTWDQIIICDIDGQLYVGMDHTLIDGHSFDGSIVYASACLAGKDKSSNTSLMQAFLNNGASIYIGFEDEINSKVCEVIDAGILGLLSHGVSFQDATQYWIYSNHMAKTVDSAIDTKVIDQATINPKLFVYRINPDLSGASLFLKESIPSLYPTVVENNQIRFAWDTGLGGFTTYYFTFVVTNQERGEGYTVSHPVNYTSANDLYIDGQFFRHANQEKSLIISADEFSAGEHSWYVTSSLYDEENNIVCTYSSNQEKLNIPEPIKNLVISQNSVVVNPCTTTTVEITSGNGDYTVSVDKPTIATASVSGTTITIKGVAKGTAKVTVKDKSGQTAEINVNVWDNLTLSQSSVGIYAGYSTTVEITSGSGHYTVSVDKPAVATASLSGSVITIKGVGVGSAVATVTDTSTNQTAKINITVSSVPTLVVSNSSVELMVGGSSTVEITSGSGSYEITNSNANVVQAVLDGAKITLTAKAEGNVVVTVKDKSTGQTASVSITVKPIPNLVLSQSTIELTVGAEATVEIVSGSGEYSVAIDNPSIATVTLSGTTITIKGVSVGTAKITVKDKSGQTAEIIVNVWENLTLSQSSVDIYSGNSIAVKITSGNGDYTVSVDKPTIATASVSGTTITIKGVAKGTAKVTVKDLPSGEIADINVTVSTFNPSCPVGDAIDLGLSSGTMWASWNVGASAPEEYGRYYAWGETEEKEVYDWSTYIHCDGTRETCHHLADDITGTEYDVAHVKWGGPWQMPTHGQIMELIIQCEGKWTQLNGVNGFLVTGPNGNTIFLPAGGSFNDDRIYGADLYGAYWSSTPFPYWDDNPYLLYFSQYSWTWRNGTTANCEGMNIRAVIPGEITADRDCPVGKPIDLGLPSGTKWASLNVGAVFSEDDGDTFAWGETEKKNDYSMYSYEYYDKETDQYIYIGDDIAGTEYDVAHIKWGGTWRMPTREQFQELIDNCTLRWMVLSDGTCLSFKGPSGKEILLPITDHNETYGYYWSSSYNTDDEFEESAFGFECYRKSGRVYTETRDFSRYYTFHVRPVCP